MSLSLGRSHLRSTWRSVIPLPHQTKLHDWAPGTFSLHRELGGLICAWVLGTHWPAMAELSGWLLSAIGAPESLVEAMTPRLRLERGEVCRDASTSLIIMCMGVREKAGRPGRGQTWEDLNSQALGSLLSRGSQTGCCGRQCQGKDEASVVAEPCDTHTHTEIGGHSLCEGGSGEGGARQSGELKFWERVAGQISLLPEGGGLRFSRDRRRVSLKALALLMC